MAHLVGKPNALAHLVGKPRIGPRSSSNGAHPLRQANYPPLMLRYSSLAGPAGFELASSGFGDRRSAVKLRACEAVIRDLACRAGFELASSGFGDRHSTVKLPTYDVRLAFTAARLNKRPARDEPVRSEARKRYRISRLYRNCTRRDQTAHRWCAIRRLRPERSESSWTVSLPDEDLVCYNHHSKSLRPCQVGFCERAIVGFGGYVPEPVTVRLEALPQA